MNAAVLSLIALLVVIGLSLTTRINVGILAVALAWPIAVFAAGWKADALVAVFPSGLFLTLLGVTLLFGIAQKNGTLDRLTRRAIRICGGATAFFPVVFFVLTCVVATVGPGAVAATALVAPLAMSAGARASVPAFLMALMVANGGNAGNLSPFSAVGIIVKSMFEKAGLGPHDSAVFWANFVAHLAVALGAYFLFGGLTLWRARAHADPPAEETFPPFERRHWFTLGVLVTWILGVILFRANPGLSAFLAASLLIVLRAAEDEALVSAVPWAVIVMVSGVSVLIGVIEKTGGMELFTTLLSRITTPSIANGMMAFVTGVISIYSSTSGVVYPAFIPAVPGLVEKLGGGDPLQIALSVNVGAALVDVSPLSTIGALCVAAIPDAAAARIVFRQMLVWGFAMTIVGALFCQLAIRFFAF